jgi:hypothetical protein
MHPLPAERSGKRVIDAERVGQAIAALGRTGELQVRARQFAILADPAQLA